jgi:inward rectifier potassium channel
MEKKSQIFRNTPDNDLGLGNKVTSNTRLLDKSGKFPVFRKGEKIWMHPYQRLLEMSWLRFHILIISFYVFVNFLFALAYVAIGKEALSGEYHGVFMADFFKAYFFSIQTFTTVGYGSVSPICFTSNMIAAFEALFGLLIFALATGLYYAKFTRPESRIKFSDIALISPYKDGMNGLMLRMINNSHSELIEVEAMITYSWLHVDKDGIKRRSYQQLVLERNKVSLFPLNWTLVHPIDEQSPLWGKTLEDLVRTNAECLVFVKGMNTTFGQTVQATSSYLANEVLWGYKFEPMYYADEVYGTILEMDKINKIHMASLS